MEPISPIYLQVAFLCFLQIVVGWIGTDYLQLSPTDMFRAGMLFGSWTIWRLLKDPVNDSLATMAKMEKALEENLKEFDMYEKKFDEYEKKFDEYKKEIELNKEDLAKIKEDAVDLYISGASMYTTRQDIAAFIKNNLNQKYKNK